MDKQVTCQFFAEGGLPHLRRFAARGVGLADKNCPDSGPPARKSPNFQARRDPAGQGYLSMRSRFWRSCCGERP